MRICLSILIVLFTFSATFAQEREFTHHLVEVDRALNFTFMGWSPADDLMAYFRHTEPDEGESGIYRVGELRFYDVTSGDTCAYPDAAVDETYQNGERFDKNLWLENGDYFSIQAERAVIFIPCVDHEQDITEYLPAPPNETSIVSYSPLWQTVFLRTYHGLYLYNLEDHQAIRIEGAVNDFDFYFGKGSLSPSGERFAFTLSGPGDTYIIDIATTQATTVIDEPLEPGEDECCSTPREPRWFSEDYIFASTQSLGVEGGWANLIVNLTENRLIMPPDPEYRIEDGYVTPDAGQRLTLILQKPNGDYAVALSPDFVMSPRSGLDDIDIIPPGIIVTRQAEIIRASSLLDVRLPSFEIFLARPPGNYAASEHRLAVAGEQVITIYDIHSGEWIETVAPPGYHRFRLYQYKPGVSMWSSDSQSLAFEALQLGEQTLLVATLEELAFED